MSSTTEEESPSSAPSSPASTLPSSPAATDKIEKTEGEDNASDPISENPFDSESSRILFDAVDQLQHCGASRHVDIPQLVIVGGQSTGKSSLLQSLTDIPFPVGTGCCTRFATRIVSKRTAPGTANRFKITIVDPEVKIKGFEYPANNAYKEYVHAGDTLGVDEFKAVMEEVSNDYMGIKTGKGPGRKNFATQVLRVELSGPGRSFFSIVDIPGLFVNPDTVNEGEMHGIKSMIVEYMKMPENFVICVADAVTDLANQGIVHLASLHVTKERCVGVLTKCDMLRDDEEASAKVVAIATGGQEHTTKPICDTWFVVRNRSSKEDKSFDLAEAEAQLFRAAPWDQILSGRRGTRMLRSHLSSLLARRIRSSFPSIRARIQDLLAEAQRSRAVLGGARITHNDRLQYLREIAEKYEALVTNTLERPGMMEEQLRARNKVKVANEEFTKVMHTRGHRNQFEDPNLDPLEEVARMMMEEEKMRMAEKKVTKDEKSEPPKDEQPLFQFRSGVVNKPLAMPTFLSPVTPDATPTEKPIFAPSHSVSAGNGIGKALREDIRAGLRAFEGTQLPGLIHPDAIPVLFQKQTEKWHEYAAKHVVEVAGYLGVAAAGILDIVCPSASPDGNTQLHARLFDVLKGFWESSKAKALAEVETLCRQERFNPLQTTNSIFSQRLKAWQTIRLRRSLASVPPGSDAVTIHDRIHFSMEENMIDTVHDILKVYYQISMESFIRYITHNIVERFVSGPSLKGLSRKWVDSLTEAEVEQLAHEDRDTVAKRNSLDEQIQGLQAADEIARRATESTGNLSQA
ncbi:vacuolar sorting protein VPS1 [Xylaria palmicola]|nr:vacuolar sorting protein VPS1 [Xylaria palmicola]